jgi:GNAT superfamily N-acetyltransferase
MVIEGGEVNPIGLPRRVRLAEKLIFLPGSEGLLGVAALKNPEHKYRAYIAELSGVAVPASDFLYELGWVVVSPAAQNQGHSLCLSLAALDPAGNNGVLATSHNTRMQSTLLKLGFVSAGVAYPSRFQDRQIQLFLRAPSNNSFKPTPHRGIGHVPTLR